jgi:tetratricopeptide (TPR) repeat protein
MFAIIFLAILILIYPLAQNVVAADQTFSDSNNCDAIKGSDAYHVDDDNDLYAVHESNGSKNPFIYIYLKTPGGCRVLLSSQGSVVRFIKNSANKFPDVDALWHLGAEESASTYYIWDGGKYVSRQASDTERLNKEALEYFEKGDIDRAIKVWEKAKDLAIIPGLGFTSNAEVLNNLGFAYHKLAKKTGSEKHYQLALYYLDAATQVDYTRWEAYLNLGDLYLDRNDREHALASYQKVLELNPKYRSADKIKLKLAELRDKTVKKMKAKKPAPSSTSGKIAQDLTAYEYTYRIHSTLPQYKYILYLDKELYPRYIDVHRADDLRRVQELDVNDRDDILCESYSGGGKGRLTVVDMNFDGYQDIRLHCMAGQHNVSYLFWLFDKDAGKFVFHSDLSELLNPVPDPKTKSIISDVDEGCAGTCRTINTYKITGNKLVLLNSQSYTIEENGTMKKRNTSGGSAQ